MLSIRPSLLLAVVVLLAAVARPGQSQELGFQAGTNTQWFSEIQYHNYSTASATVFFPTALAAMENGGLGIELRVAYQGGNNVPITRDQATAEELADFDARGEAPNIDINHVIFAVSPIWRQRLFHPLDYEVGVGLSLLNRRIITPGTVWNVLFILGLGVELPGTGAWPTRVGVRLEHFSNGGDVGWTKARPIGLESLSLALAWRLR
jgi:hypothetical protein